MQLEMAHSSCPLCKIQLPASLAGFTLRTRLCEPCQGLVLTALRGANSAAVLEPVVVTQNGGVAQVQRDSHALDYALAGSSAFSAQVAVGGPGLEPELQHEAPLETHEGSSFSFFEDEEPNHRFETEEEDVSPVAGTGLSWLGETSCSGPAQTPAIAKPDLDHEYKEAINSHLTDESTFTVAATHSGSVEESGLEDGQQEESSIVDQAATDPLATSLPAWEYPHDEWPVLVGPTRSRSLFTPRMALAAVAILLAVGAGVYVLFLRTSAPPQRANANAGAPEREAVGGEPHASASMPENAVAIKGASTAAAAVNPSSNPADVVVHEGAPSNENNSAQGRFSLQAAAFPTQAGADEFAEKLKRAGVPSYVAPVELARRGKWFRVRVGRFNAAEDAQKFAGEAQQRARAAGLSLQLIVCQYDQP